MAIQDPRTSPYELLAVHPNAPADLIAASYWFLVGQLQARRSRGEYVDGALHELTRAYECISDPGRRSEYDASIGHTLEPLAQRPLRSPRRSLRSRLLGGDVPAGPMDFYEVLGVSPAAPPELLPTAHQIMLNQYLRVPPGHKKRLLLLKALDEAYATLSAPDKREAYDRRVKRKTVDEPPAADPPAPAKPEPAVQAARQSAGKGAPRRSVLALPRGLCRTLAAGVRMPYNGARALQSRRTRSARVTAERPVKSPRPPEPPILREPAPRPRAATIDVEEALVGRIAAYVKDIQSLHVSTEPREGIDGPPAPHP